jgi:hypothetical protein
LPAIVYQAARVADAANRLTSGFRDKPKAIALVTALCGTQAQAFEDAWRDVQTAHTIDGAITLGGVPLDELGALLGQDRDGLSDESYGRYIRARIRINRSQGLADDALMILRALLPDRSRWQIVYSLRPPATFEMRIVGDTITAMEARDFQALLQEGALGGVRVVLIYSTLAPEASFSFLHGPGLGFGDGGFSGAY